MTVVETYCAECAKWHPYAKDNKDKGMCYRYGRPMNGKDFCSKAERCGHLSAAPAQEMKV